MEELANVTRKCGGKVPMPPDYFAGNANDLAFLQSKDIAFEAPKLVFEDPDGSPFLYLPDPDHEMLGEDSFDSTLTSYTSEDFDDVLSLLNLYDQLAEKRELV